MRGEGADVSGRGLVTFDVAGTTVDEGGRVYEVLRAVTEAAGARYDDETFARHTGTEKRRAVGELLRLGGAACDDATADRVHREFVTGLADAYAQRPPTPVAGAEETFDRLRRAGMRVALTTGFDRQTLDRILRGLGWTEGGRGTVDLTVCATEVAHGRPAPDMILRARDLLGRGAPEPVWAVGDTPADMAAGRAAGAATVGVRTGHGDDATLREHGADVVVDSVARIDPDLLRSLVPGGRG